MFPGRGKGWFYLNMFGKKEIYTGKDDDRLARLLSALKEAKIKYEFGRSDSHLPDVRTGAAVGRYGENGGSGLISSRGSHSGAVPRRRPRNLQKKGLYKPPILC